MDDPTDTALPPEATEIAAGGSFTEVSSNFADYVLAEIHVAELRARFLANELRTMAIAFSAGFIDIDNAIAHLTEVGALHLIGASSS